MFDAYTVKKVLPRLLIAVVAIQLSWFIFTGLITLTNSVAYGVEGLILAPFAEGGEFKTLGEQVVGIFEGDSADSGQAIGETGIFAAAVAGGIGIGFALGIAGILSIAVTLLLALLIGFFVLVLRQVVLLGLLVIAPLALVAWILPGTEKWWKLWWESFSKLLIMYPMILGMIAAGRAFSSIAFSSSQASTSGAAQDVVMAIIAILAIIAPFFLIPKTFQLAGSAFASLTGIVNDKNKGLFDRLKNYRGNKAKENWANTKAGNRFKGGTSNNFRGRLNRGLQGATMIKQAGLNPRNMRTKMRTALNDSSEVAVDEASKHPSFVPWSGDDAKLWAAKFENHDQIAAELERRDAGRFAGAQNRNRREEAVAQILRSQREMGTDVFQKARLRAQAKTGTGYQDANGKFNAAMMLDDINDVYGSDRNGAGRALAEMRGALTQSGQVAGQAGYATWATQMEDRQNNAVSQIDAHNAIMDDAIDSVQPGYAVYGKALSAAAFGAAHNRRIQAIAAGVQAGTNTMDDLSAAVANAAGVADAMGQSSPGNASAFVNELFNQPISGLAFPGNYGPANSGTVRDWIDYQMANNPEFVARRTAMSARNAAAAQLLQQQQGPGPGAPPAAGGQPPIPGAPSDYYLKKNIHRLTTLNNGVHLYQFEYIWSTQKYVGVIAQDLIGTSYENCINIDPSGYLSVDYNQLGIKFLTYDEWLISEQTRV